MAENCVCRLLGGLCSFVITSLRVILFLACTLGFLVNVALLYVVFVANEYVSEFKFPGFTIGPTDYVHLILAGLLLLTGAHGAYSRNPKYLKTFALGISVYAVLFICIAVTEFSTTDWKQQQLDFDEKMRSYAKDYEFDAKPGAKLNEATRAWDLIQSKLFCCGLEKPQDWFKWRSGLKQNLPHSCCLNFPGRGNDVCRLDEPYVSNIGCNQAVGTLISNALFGAIMKTVLFLFFGLIAVVVAKQHEPDFGSGAPSAGRASGDSANYQRFDGSVYVRQPPTNENYAQAGAPASGKPMEAGGQLYPNVHKSSPPPSYVARA